MKKVLLIVGLLSLLVGCKYDKKYFVEMDGVETEVKRCNVTSEGNLYYTQLNGDYIDIPTCDKCKCIKRTFDKNGRRR